MARTAKSRNLFGFSFGRKETVHKSKGTTRAQMKSEAFRAGQKSGDTGLFNSWVRSKKLDTKWDRDTIRDFERSYREGVERGEAIERKAEAKREAVKEKREAVKAQKTEVAETVKEVTDALIAQGMKKGQASRMARSKYRKGDSFEDLWRRVVSKENPENSAKTLSSAGYHLVDRFSSREAAEEVARGYVPFRIVFQGPLGRAAKWEVWTKQAGNPSGPSQLLSQSLGYLPYGGLVRDAGKHVFKNPKGGKFDRCVTEVSKRGGVDSPYAVCQKSVGRVENFFGLSTDKGKTTHNAETLQRIGDETAKREGVVIVNWGGKSLSGKKRMEGQAFLATTGERVVKGPKPTTLNRLFIILHEIGHHHYRHTDQDEGKQLSNTEEAREEQEANRFALDILRRNHIDTREIEREEDARIRDIYGSRKNPHREAFRLSPNPLDQAEKLYRDFTGLEPTGVIETQEQEHFHEFTTRYGTLVCLDILTVDGREIPLVSKGFHFEPRKYLARNIRHSEEAKKAKASWFLEPKTPAKDLVGVTFSEDGKQMIFRGGDQSIPWKDLGLTDRDQRDQMFIGTIVEITYRGKKKFELNGQDEVDFHHPFGNQGSRGIMPLLCYLDRTKRMVTFGGRYETAPVRKDIGASPGIVG